MQQRQLPTIEQLEPAAREYCRLMGNAADLSSYDHQKPYWRHIAGNLRYELATRWALEVFERGEDHKQ